MNDNTVNYHSKLVGVTFEGRQEVIQVLKGDEPLRVRREPENEYDPKAVAVDVMFGESWAPIGYIAKDKNSDISKALDAGNEVKIAIGSITGGDGKSYGVNISLEYSKATEAPSQEASVEPAEALTAQEKLQRAVDEYVAELISGEKTMYTSRILGKTTEVTIKNGHVGLPGYSSGSAFPGKFYATFEEEENLQKIADKFDVDKEHVRAMWALNRDVSTGYGTAIHAAMQNYDTYYKLGDKIKKVEVLKTKTKIGPNKALSRNPFIKKIVEDFHRSFGGDYVRLSEQFIWLHDEKLCGTIDRIKVVDAKNKIVRIQDFKTDGDIHEKKYQLSTSPFKKEMGNELLDYHWLQLSFYAYILKKYGYQVEGLDIYWLNPNKLCQGVNAWEYFSHGVIKIEKGL